ncbi:MAG: DNA polymerase II [Acidobacteria bacterium]|nr:DNA polymerase II [Acidobacteriota bacterium]
MKTRGFILHPTYRVEAGRPVVHLYGRLESGETFLIRDDRSRPHFYVRQRDRELANDLGAAPLADTGLVTLRGAEPVLRVEVAIPGDTPALRDRLHRAGVVTYEADVRFAMRHLIDHGIRSAVAIEGSPRRKTSNHPGPELLFENPRLEPVRLGFEPRVLSLDLETDLQGRQVLSAALYGCGVEEVLLLAPRGLETPAGAIPFATEGALLEGISRRILEIDPDVLTGWNVVDFDLRVLAEAAERCRVTMALGRGGEALRLRPTQGARPGLQAIVMGRVVLDGIQLVRTSFVRMEEHSLDFVARQVVGEGKLISGGDRGADILHAFRHDRRRFVDYNLLDAKLVLDILAKLRLIELTVERSLLTGLPLDRVSASVAAFDFLYLSELGRRGIVAPSVSAPGSPVESAAAGGHVLEPTPGLYEHVLVFDFKSLYPSLIRTFQIDPLGYRPDAKPGDDVIVAPNGAAFARQPGVLPSLLDELAPRREAARAEGNAIASQAIKILMNSFYGVLGTPSCRFYDPALANAITSFGRELLLWTKARIEHWGHRVLYGDTDSLFVQVGAKSDEDAREQGRELTERLNAALAEHVRDTWGVESRLELELDKHFLRLMLPAMRHSTLGARKRYAGLVETASGERKVEFTGMEVVRRDWTELARRLQRDLYERLFHDRPVDEYLRHSVRELRAGEIDDLLVYKKALRKDLGAYTSSSPPHVVAARKLRARRGDLIHYVVTGHGPEPADRRHAPLDYEHYVDKQIRPVAEPVLHLLGLDFAKVIGDDRQLDLF